MENIIKHYICDNCKGEFTPEQMEIDSKTGKLLCIECATIKRKKKDINNTIITVFVIIIVMSILTFIMK